MQYNLTNNQKHLLNWIVKSVRTEILREEFSIHRHLSGFILKGYTGIEDDIPNMTNSVLEALASEDLIHCKPIISNSPRGSSYESGKSCVLKGNAYYAVDHDFNMPPTQPHVTIGAMVQSMSGGNIQAIGLAQDAEIKQIVNDPELYNSQIEALFENIVNAVKNDLKANELADYSIAIKELKELIKSENIKSSNFRSLIKTIGFLGNIEGSISLMTRVWPFVHPLLVILAEKFAT